MSQFRISQHSGKWFVEKYKIDRWKRVTDYHNSRKSAEREYQSMTTGTPPRGVSILPRY